MPHLLFYGPPGTGKTSTILAVAKQIYSGREFNSMVLEVGELLNQVSCRPWEKLKTVSAESSSNKCKNYLPKIYSKNGNVLYTI